MSGGNAVQKFRGKERRRVLLNERVIAQNCKHLHTAKTNIAAPEVLKGN
jgi:hypothetical protein